MKNCVTTKLKEAVTGNGFFKANELVFKLIATENTWLWWLSQYTSVTTATLEGGAYFVSNEGSTESLGTSKQVVGDGVSIFVPKGEHYLKIQDKTKVTALGSADLNTWTFDNFINSTSPSFKTELHGETLKYATNITFIHLTNPHYLFYELSSVFRNKNIIKADITANDILVGTVKELFEGAGTIGALSIKNQTKLTGDTSILYGKEIKELTFSGNIFDVSLNDLYNIKGGTGITITNHLGKIRGNPLNLNDDVSWIGLSNSEDIILDNDNGYTPRTRVISGEGLRFLDSGAIDAFLIANATKTPYPNLNTLSPWIKTISIYGIRTSASDTAVATLTSKGYTVTML